MVFLFQDEMPHIVVELVHYILCWTAVPTNRNKTLKGTLFTHKCTTPVQQWYLYNYSTVEPANRIDTQKSQEEYPASWIRF